MPYIMYYSTVEDEVGQTFVENGTPIDIYASELGIIAMSMDEFPGVTTIQIDLPEDAVSDT